MTLENLNIIAKVLRKEVKKTSGGYRVGTLGGLAPTGILCKTQKDVYRVLARVIDQSLPDRQKEKKCN